MTDTDTGPEIAVAGTTTVRLVPPVAVEAATVVVPVAVLNCTTLLLAIMLKFDPVSVTIVLRVARAGEMLRAGPPPPPPPPVTPGGVKVMPGARYPAATLARNEPI